MFHDMSIARRLSLIVITAVVGVICVLVAAMLMLRSDMLNGAVEATRNINDSASSIVKEYLAKDTTGAVSTENAQAFAMDAMRAIRFGDGGYIFVVDLKGTFLMNPGNPQLEGTNGTALHDKEGDYFIKRMLDLVEADPTGGSVSYFLARPGNSEVSEKLAYVRSFPEWGWMIGATVYMDTVFDTFVNNALILAGIVLVLLVGMVGLSILIRGSITKPLTDLTDGMERLSQGDTTISINSADSKSEIGAFARALSVFRENARERTAMVENERAAEKAAAERARTIETLCSEFDGSIRDLLSLVGTSVGNLNGASQALSSGAQESSGKTSEVAVASESASTNVQTVAAATEELHASVSEISRQVQISSQIAAEAVEQAQNTDATMQGLSEAVGRISDVVGLINDVASQTNLLALNATIEAARAGDAGKGFAVVANEVKSLANQTSRATEEIEQQISSVQSETRSAVDAIRDIVGTIERISETASGIASAVEEQDAATQEIARNVQEAARGTDQVSQNIQIVSSSVDNVETTAGEVYQVARELSEEADGLRGMVDDFLKGLRSA